MIKIGDIVDGQYEILKEIGHGGMSTVYLAMDKRLNKQWAVKEIKKEGSNKNKQVVLNSLLVEAELMKKLDHPSLPRIVSIINDEQTISIIMDYIEGETLEKIIKEYGAQPQDTVIEWAMQLCDVLSYLHRQNPPIIYRDMKPANIMLKPEGNLKVFDFGVAREYKEKSLADTTILGTKGFAPPEQFGSRQTDARSDIYALGMTMHNLLTGIDPRTPGYEYASIRQYRPELSDSLEYIIDKCTAIDANNRYQSCDELMYDLQHIEQIEGGYKKKQKRKLGLFIASAILTVVCAASGLVLRITASNMDKNNYESLIGLSEATSYDEKIDSYTQAIAIYPNDTRAYEKLLEAYEFEGTFGKEQNDGFLALYNKNKDSFDKTSLEFAELNYKVGMMYFNYYNADGEEVQFSERVQKAYPFFKDNYDNAPNSFDEKELSDCYYQICNFYKVYILNNVNVQDPSKSVYDELLTTIESAMQSVENAGTYDKLTLYNGAFMLLYDQRMNMVSTNVDKDRILSLMDNINSKTNSLPESTKEQTKKLQTEIGNYYEEYKTAIERAYENFNSSDRHSEVEE